MSGRKFRTAHLARLGLTLLVLTMVAFGTFWLAQVMNRGASDGKDGKASTEPDYYIHNFSLVRMTPDGKPSYITSGIKLTHYPADDSSDIDQPFVRDLAQGKAPTNIRAERAHVDQDNTRIQLNQNVTIIRPAAPGSDALDLKTEALTVFPDSDRMETALPVEIKLGSAVLTGIGMKANNATGQLDVLDRAHLTYPPKAR
jgi:lipopolysaccharide export system protein LptC